MNFDSDNFIDGVFFSDLLNGRGYFNGKFVQVDLKNEGPVMSVGYGSSHADLVSGVLEYFRVPFNIVSNDINGSAPEFRSDLYEIVGAGRAREVKHVLEDSVLVHLFDNSMTYSLCPSSDFARIFVKAHNSYAFIIDSSNYLDSCDVDISKIIKSEF